MLKLIEVEEQNQVEHQERDGEHPSAQLIEALGSDL